MPLQSNHSDKQLLFIIALLLGSVEVLLPRFPILPWLKIGLPNIITLIWLFRYGVKEAFLFSLLRIWLLALFFGFSPFTMALAVSGSVLSIFIISIMYKIRIFGIILIGIIGAMAHNSGQLLALHFLFKGIPYAPFQIKMMIIASLITGTITALGAFYLEPLINSSKTKITKNREIAYSLGLVFISLLFIISIAYINSLNSLILQIVVSFLIILSYLAKVKNKKNILFLIKNFWLFLALIFISHFRFKDDWIIDGAIHSFTIFIWLLSSLWLIKLKFDNFIYHILKKLFPNSKETFDVALSMVTLFPQIVEVSRELIISKPHRFLQNPYKSLVEIVDIAKTL